MIALALLVAAIVAALTFAWWLLWHDELVEPFELTEEARDVTGRSKDSTNFRLLDSMDRHPSQWSKS